MSDVHSKFLPVSNCLISLTIGNADRITVESSVRENTKATVAANTVVVE